MSLVPGLKHVFPCKDTAHTRLSKHDHPSPTSLMSPCGMMSQANTLISSRKDTGDNDLHTVPPNKNNMHLTEV